MSLKLRVATVASTIAATMALGITPASAAILTSTGCIEWSAAGGCQVTQTCKVNTDTRYWVCYTNPSNGSQPTMQGAGY